MENLVLFMILLALIVVVLIYMNVQLREDKERAQRALKKLTNPIFFETVAPFELVVYYQKLYLEAKTKANEFQKAFLCLNLEWAQENDDVGLMIRYMNAKDVVDAYVKKEILTKNWLESQHNLPHISIDSIKEDEKQFRAAFSAAYQKL